MRIHEIFAEDSRGFVRICKTLGEDLWDLWGFTRLWERICGDLWGFTRLWERICGDLQGLHGEDLLGEGFTDFGKDL